MKVISVYTQSEVANFTRGNLVTISGRRHRVVRVDAFLGEIHCRRTLGTWLVDQWRRVFQ